MKKAFLVLVVGALVGACSGIRVQTDWDQSVDFSAFETFTILEEQSAGSNPFVTGRVRRAIIDELTARGLREVAAAEEADLAVGFQVATEIRRTYQTVYSSWHSRGYRHGRRGWPNTSTVTATTSAREYTVGALVIAIFDGTSKELVWEASGSRRVDQSGSPERREQRIRDAVERVLADFPPS